MYLRLTRAEKLIQRHPQGTQDIFLSGSSRRTAKEPQEQYRKGLDMLKAASGELGTCERH